MPGVVIEPPPAAFLRRTASTVSTYPTSHPPLRVVVRIEGGRDFGGAVAALGERSSQIPVIKNGDPARHLRNSTRRLAAQVIGAPRLLSSDLVILLASARIARQFRAR